VLRIGHNITMVFDIKDAFLGKNPKKKDIDFSLNKDYLNRLSVIEIGALNGEVLDYTEHFDKFFPTLEEFLKEATRISQNPNKTVNLDYLNYGIHVPHELSIEKEAIEYVLPFYNSIDSRSGVDWRNVLPITILPAVLGAFGAALVNPNLVTGKYGKRANELEVRVVKSLAKILGYKDLDKAWGLALEGSTKGNMYGYLLGLRKAFPQIKEEGLMGLTQKFMFANSQAGHFSNFTNLAAIGTGRKNAIRIAANAYGCIKTKALKEKLENCYKQGIVVPTVLLTIGTTDHCAIDDVKECYEVVEELAEKYPDMPRPHIHLDAAIGWSLTFFNDYDIEANPLSLKESFVEKLPKIQDKCRNLHYADSITLDMHKTGFAPYSSSFLIVKNIRDFEYMMWDSGEFKYFDPSEDKIAPVQYSLECTRSSSGVYATAMALKSLGVEGYQTLLSAGLQYSNMLKEKFISLDNIAVINPELGFTSLFRPYPSFVKNAQELLRKELYDESFQENSKKLSAYIDEFYKFWKMHKSPSTALLDFVRSAAWAQYGNQDYELPSWKAYMLNPRVGKHIKPFLDEFLSLRSQFERIIPDEDLEELKIICS
jgi:L-2,4-diaminobutyrate decarboxylase